MDDELNVAKHVRTDRARLAAEPTAGGVCVVEDDLAYLARLAERGVVRPVIDRVVPLADVVEAHRYVDVGHKRGNVVLRVAAS